MRQSFLTIHCLKIQCVLSRFSDSECCHLRSLFNHFILLIKDFEKNSLKVSSSIVLEFDDHISEVISRFASSDSDHCFSAASSLFCSFRCAFCKLSFQCTLRS